MNEVSSYLETLYQEALSGQSEAITSNNLTDSLKHNIDIVIQNSENSKAVLAVTLTSLIYKALHPDQDIRNHQASIPNGYAGRIFDMNHITPFLRSKSFPCMAESGWLTRSLEQKHPYTLDYPGAITPKI